MKLKNLFIASGIALALPISVVTFSHAFGKEALRANASIATGVSIGINGIGAGGITADKYYKNTDSIFTPSNDPDDYNYIFHSATGTLDLKGFDGNTIKPSGGDLIINLVGSTQNRVGSSSMIDDYDQNIIYATAGSINIGGTGSLTIHATKAADGSKDVYGIRTDIDGGVVIEDSASVVIDFNEAKSVVYGIKAGNHFEIKDSASMEVNLVSNSKAASYGISTVCGDMLFNSAGTVDIYFGASHTHDDTAIYNKAYTYYANPLLYHDNGKISFTGSGKVTLTQQGDGFADGIVSEWANPYNTEGIIMFDGSDVNVQVDHFSRAVWSRSKYVTSVERADIVIQNQATLSIDSSKNESDTATGLISTQNGVLIENGNFTYNGTGKPVDVSGENGYSSDSTFGFDVIGNSHVDITVDDYDTSYIASKVSLTSNFDLTGTGYINYQTKTGKFPATGMDCLYIELGNSSKLPYISYMSSTTKSSGTHYGSSVSIPYRIEAFTPPSSSAIVYLGGVTLTAEKPYYHNGDTEPSDNGSSYNAYYEFNTGLLHLYEYDAGPISLSDSTVGSLFRIVLEGDSTITYDQEHPSTTYGLNVGGNASLEVYTPNTNSHSLSISVSNNQGDVTGLGTQKGFVRFTGYTSIYITAETKDADTAREVKGINTNYVGGGNGQVSFEGHSYGYIIVNGQKAASISSCISANSGKIVFNTQNSSQYQFMANDFVEGATYTLWSSSGVEFTHYSDIYLSWHEDGVSCGPTNDDDDLNNVSNGAVNRNNTSHVASIVYGEAYHIDIVNGECDAKEGNYVKFKTAYLTAGAIDALTFVKWELTGDGMFVNDTQTSRNGNFTVLGNAKIEATYDFVEQAPFFDTRGNDVPGDGYIHFKLKGNPTLVNVISEDRENVIYSSNVRPDIQFTAGDLPGDTYYRLRAKYESGGKTFYLDSEKFYVDYNAEAHDYNFKLESGAGEGDDIIQVTHGNVQLPEFIDTGFVAPYGYKFASWGGYAASSVISITDDLTLTAQYTALTPCTISFSAGEGTGSKDPVDSFIEYSYTLPSTAPEFTAPENYELNHWLVNGVEKALGATIDLEEASYTVVAVYSRIQCAVTFSAGEGTGSMAGSVHDKGSTFNLPTALENEFVAPAHKQFKCWSINGVEYAPGAEYTITGNVTITAVYESIMRTVTFVANGGTGTMAPVSVAEGSSYTLPANGFTAPEGKQFDGWMINETKYAAGASVTIEADTTIKAIWKDIPVTPDEPDTPSDSDTPDTPDTPTPEKKGLSAGAIVAIVVPSVLVAAIGGFALVWFVILKKSWADFVAIFKKK